MLVALAETVAQVARTRVLLGVRGTAEAVVTAPLEVMPAEAVAAVAAPPTGSREWASLIMERRRTTTYSRRMGQRVHLVKAGRHRSQA